MRNLTQLQKQLCNILQEGLPVCEKPFAQIAKVLDVDEERALEQIRKLKNTGIIRRFRAIINYNAIGKIGTLVTAHVPQESLDEIAEAVNRLEGVSHNYLRDNFYNLWFTLQAKSNEEIEKILSNLFQCFGIEFHSLPVVRTFKLEVRFDVENKKCKTEQEAPAKPKSEAVKLDANEKLVIEKLQKEIQITAEPFSNIVEGKLKSQDVLKITQKLIEKDVIRRIAAVLDYHKLGFDANILFACEVPQERILETGEKLARCEMVSHCYERKTFEGWPYNLFAMMHSRSIEEIKRAVKEFTESEKIKSYQLLPTVAELKKQPVEHKFD